MTWTVLGRELDRWADAGRVATLWWRDDDAVSSTPALAPLLGLAARHGVPVALAVVPAALEASLVDAVRAARGCTVLQHGFRHENHAAAGTKSRELGGTRAADDVVRDLAAGRDCLRDAFGARFLQVVVPPWNRIDAEVVRRLPALGCVGLSTFGPRSVREAAPGVVQCNTHVDPIAWRAGRSFVGAGEACASLAAHLAARLTGQVDADEPSGLLTHHLVFDAAAWSFVDDLLHRTTRHAAARWIAPAQAFATSVRSA